MRHIQNLKRIFRSQEGLAMMEFALLLPILVLLCVGGIELTRFVLFNQKIDNSTSRVADLITQLNVDSVPCEGTGGLKWNNDTMMVRAMAPYDYEGNGVMVVSAVQAEYADPDNPNDNDVLNQRVLWQWSSNGAQQSKFATQGQLVNGSGAWPLSFLKTPNLGGMYNGDRVVAVEVFYDYEPLFPGFEFLVKIDNLEAIYKTAFYRARFGNQTSLSCG